MNVNELLAGRLWAVGMLALFATADISATPAASVEQSSVAGQSSIDGAPLAIAASAESAVTGSLIAAPAETAVAGSPSVVPSVLLTVDQNRTTVVNRIVTQWGDALGASGAGISKRQLEEMLTSLRADQLLVASLAGNLDGLRAVIDGAVSANAGSQAKLIATKALGASGSDLVYTPVSPCRLFDTRASQGGLGTPTLNVRRTYGAITPVPSQGGTGGCAAGASATVALIQIGTLTPSGNGLLQGGAQGVASFPNALILYQAGDQYGTAVAMPLNPTNGRFDLVEQFATADLYGDLLGYFSAPSTIDLTFGGGTSIASRSTSGINAIDIDAANGDAALRFFKTGVGKWSIRNRPADDYLEIFELDGGGSRLVIQDATGNVGIGVTTSPTYKLDVQHVGGTGIRSKSSSSFSVVDIDAASGDAGLRFFRSGVSTWLTRNDPLTDNYQIFEQGGGGERLRIENSTGKVVIAEQLGIGVTPTFQLQLSENSAAKPTSNAWTIVSDVRVKQNIAPFTDGLATLLRINPVSYDLNGKAGTPKGEHGISVIAQEAREVVPYMISSFKAKLNPDDAAETDVLSFDSGALSFVTINAIKELVVMMGNQAATKDAEIAALKKKNASLEARLSAIERRLK